MKKQIAIAVLAFLALIGVAVALIKTGPKPRVRPVQETVRTVKAIKAEECLIQPRVTGYGEAEPDKTWTAIAQIAGRIVWVSDKLENGEFVAKDQELLRLDAREYELAVGTSQANLKKIEAAIKEKNTAKANLERRRDLLRKVLDLSEKNLERQKTLHDSKTISSSALEQEEISVLQQRNNLANLESELNLVPAQLASLEAELKVAKIALEQAELNLSYTVIRAPFAGRVSTITAEIEQYAAKGNSLFKVDSIDRAEIMTSLSVDQLAIIAAPGVSRQALREQAAAALEARMQGAAAPQAAAKAPEGAQAAPAAESPNAAPAAPADKKEAAPAPRRPKKPLIRVSAVGGDAFVWKGEFLRFGAEIDTDTRMVSSIVAVDEPYKRVPGHPHLPLNKGIFCKVDFFGEPRPALVVPRSAIHDGKLYIATPEGTLEMRPIKLQFAIDSFAVVAEGLRPGETVVTSDIVPAVAGMKITPVLDGSFYDAVRAEMAPAAE